jgi:hypothetical protein
MPRKSKSGGASGPNQSSRKGKQPAASKEAVQPAGSSTAAGSGAATSSSKHSEVEHVKLLKRLSTAPGIAEYAALAGALTAGAQSTSKASPSSASISSSSSTAPLSDLAGAVARGLNLLENWAVEQGPTALEAMALIADDLAAAWAKARSADNAAKLKMVHTVVEAGAADPVIPVTLVGGANRWRACRQPRPRHVSHAVAGDQHPRASNKGGLPDLTATAVERCPAGLLSGIAAAGQVLPVTIQYLLVEDHQQQLQQQQQQAAAEQQQQQGSSHHEDYQQQQQQRQGRPLPAGLAEQLQLAGALLRLINSASLWWPGKLLLGHTFSAVVVPACSLAEAVLVCSERRRTSSSTSSSSGGEDSSSSSSWSGAELAALTTAEMLCSALIMEEALPPRNAHSHALAASGQLQHLLMVLLAATVQALYEEASPAAAAAAVASEQHSISPDQRADQADYQQQQQQAGRKYHEVLWGALELPQLARSPEQAAACRSAFGGCSAASIATDVAQVLYNAVLYRSEVAARTSSMRASMQDEAEQQQGQQMLEVVPSVMMVPLLLTCIQLLQLSPAFNSVDVCVRLMCVVHHMCSHSYPGASEQEVQAAALTAAVTSDLLVEPFLVELAPALLQAIQPSNSSAASGSDSRGAAAEGSSAPDVGNVAGMEMLMPRQAQLFMFYQALLCEVLLAGA